MSSLNKPLVSVMMPVYNGREMIDASIQSLLKQTFTDWECIIVNDGSTDGTASYLSTLKDKRFRIITFDSNQGRAAAREKALQLASGELLAMLDADDLYHPEKLERQVKAMMEHPEIALVGCSICSFGVKSDILYKRAVVPGIFKFDGILPAHASSMLRTERAKAFHYNKLLNYAEDVDFMRRYLDDQKYMIVPDVLYYYSELDSITKEKLIAYYKNGIIHGLSKLKEGASLLILNGLKLLYGKTIYPFTKIERKLLKRGIPVSDSDLHDYNKFIKGIITNRK